MTEAQALTRSIQDLQREYDVSHDPMLGQRLSILRQLNQRLVKEHQREYKRRWKKARRNATV